MLVTNTAQASAPLDSWQSYGGMVKQDAICAAYYRLMELQTEVNPCLGNYIRKATAMPDQ